MQLFWIKLIFWVNKKNILHKKDPCWGLPTRPSATPLSMRLRSTAPHRRASTQRPLPPPSGPDKKREICNKTFHSIKHLICNYCLGSCLRAIWNTNPVVHRTGAGPGLRPGPAPVLSHNGVSKSNCSQPFFNPVVHRKGALLSMTNGR